MLDSATPLLSSRDIALTAEFPDIAWILDNILVNITIEI